MPQMVQMIDLIYYYQPYNKPHPGILRHISLSSFSFLHILPTKKTTFMDLVALMYKLNG